MRASSSSESTWSEVSPRRDFAGDPVTPTMSPRCTSISPVRSTGQRSWMRPERSTRSRNTSLPMSRRAITRAASRRFVSAVAPFSSGSASARTAAISSRSGKRFGAAMVRESSGGGSTPDRPADEYPDAEGCGAEHPGGEQVRRSWELPMQREWRRWGSGTRSAPHAELAVHLAADAFTAGAELVEDLHCYAVAIPCDRKQQVLGTDEVVTHRLRFTQAELEHPLCPRRERDLAGCDLVTLADDRSDLVADGLDLDVDRGEHPGGKAALFTEQAEQNVLGADVVVMQRSGLVLR